MAPPRQEKNAAVYRAGAPPAARVSLAGRTVAGPEEVVGGIRAAGGSAQAAGDDPFDGCRGEGCTGA